MTTLNSQLDINLYATCSYEQWNLNLLPSMSYLKVKVTLDKTVDQLGPQINDCENFVPLDCVYPSH